MTPYYETLSKMNERKRQKTSTKADSKLLLIDALSHYFRKGQLLDTLKRLLPSNRLKNQSNYHAP